MAHHLHLAGVVPDVGPDDATGTCHPLHFGNCFCLVGNEIYDEARYGRVIRTSSNRQFLRITNLKGRAPICHFEARERDKTIRRINTRHVPRSCPGKDHLAQCSCAGPDIEPVLVWLHTEPRYELSGNQAAPPAYVRLIGITASPYVLALSSHCVAPNNTLPDSLLNVCPAG